jgi:PAS domain S-box-containing protein
MVKSIRSIARYKQFMAKVWRPFSNWGVQPGMESREVFHTRIVNQLSLLAIFLGLVRVLVTCILADWNTFFLGLFMTSLWIFPPWLNRMGYPHTAKLAFLGLYLFIFVFFTLITAESNGHWGVFFVAAAAVLFYTDKATIWAFGILGLLLYITCELWIQTMPPLFDIKYSLFNTMSTGLSIGLTFFLLFTLLANELQSSEEKALSDKERLDAIIKGALDAVITINTENTITAWNPQAAHIFGYTEAEALGKCLGELVMHEGYRQAHVQDVGHYLVSEEGHLLNKRIEIEGRRKNGETFPLELAIIPVEKNNERFFSAFIRDITELKKAREQLLTLNDELKHFASVASHDLREPLRNIKAFTEILLEDTPQNEQAQEYIAFIQDATQRMSKLLTDLIAFARAEADPGSPHGVDLNQTLKAARSNLTLRLHESGAEIIAGDLPVVLGHASPYIQLFQNLLSNSIKFQAPGNRPRIQLEASRVGEHWRIAFRDNGIGIPPDKADEIFKPFQRLHSDGDIEGSGIGLATCRKIAERYGGRIWAEPAPGGGSVFLVLLPAAS